MEVFLNLLDSIVPIKSNLIEDLNRVAYLVKLQNRSIFLQEGETAEYVYFNLEGAIRSFKIDVHGDWTNWFFGEGDMVFSTSGFFSGQLSRDNLQTISDCSLMRISKRNFDELCRRHDDFRMIFDILFDRFLSKRWEHNRSLSVLGATQRYEWFQSNFRSVNQLVQLRHLASYLGIAPQHLSRIRSGRQVIPHRGKIQR